MGIAAPYGGTPGYTPGGAIPGCSTYCWGRTATSCGTPFTVAIVVSGRPPYAIAPVPSAAGGTTPPDGGSGITPGCGGGGTAAAAPKSGGGVGADGGGGVRAGAVGADGAIPAKRPSGDCDAGLWAGCAGEGAVGRHRAAAGGAGSGGGGAGGCGGAASPQSGGAPGSDGGGGVRIGGGGDACRPASDASAICCDAATGSVRGRGGRAREERGWAARAGEGRREAACASSSRRSTGTEVTERPSTCGGRSGAHGGWRCDPGRKRRKVAGAQAAYQVGELRRGRRRCRVLRLCEALQRLRGREKQRRGAQALRRRDSEAAIRRRRNSCAVAPGARRGGTRSLRRSRPRGAVRIRRLAAHVPLHPLFPQQQKKVAFLGSLCSYKELLDEVERTPLVIPLVSAHAALRGFLLLGEPDSAQTLVIRHRCAGSPESEAKLRLREKLRQRASGRRRGQ